MAAPGHRLTRKLFRIFARAGFAAHLLRGIYTRFFSFPKILQILITNECNLDCIYCYVDRKDRASIPREQCFDILDQAKKMRVRIITFTGGEPFLYPHLKELLTRASDLKFDIEILTNGTLIDEEWVRFLKGISERVNLSLVFKFSYDRDTYKFHTGADTFDTVVSNIKRCAGSTIKVFAFVVLTRQELACIEETLENSKRLGVWPVFQRYIPGKDRRVNKLLEISAGDYAQGLIKFRDFYQKNKNIYGSYTYFSAKLRGAICACYRDMVVISAQGDILPCPAAPPGLSIGNINTITLKEAWRLYKKEQSRWLELSPVCFKCKIKDICGGGCISHKYLEHGKFCVDDPLCFSPDEIATVEGLSAPCRMHENY